MTELNEQNTQMGKPKRNRRKKYVVDPGFQWRFAATISVTVFLVSSIMGSVLYGVLHQQARLRLMHPETYTAEVSTVVLFASIIFAALTAGGVAVWCIGATHRICGPLYVVQQGFHQMMDGKFPQLRRLRKKDEFNQFYKVFLQTVDSLKERKQKDLDALNDTLDMVSTAMNAVGTSQKDSLESVAQKLQALRDETAKALGEEKGAPSCACASRCDSACQEPVGVS